MTDHTDHTAYRVTVDTEACEGIFACLVRDERFVESDEGLATFDPDAVEGSPGDAPDAGEIVAEFDDDRRADAEQAAAACPPGAISVEAIDGETIDGEAVDPEVAGQ
jgi:ferredoxin